MKFKTISLLFILTLAGIGCYGQTDGSFKGRFEIDQTLKSGKKFFVQDSSQYSPFFLAELRGLDSQYESVRLTGKYLILDKSDTNTIPVELPANVMVNYQVVKRDTVYNLGLRRINFTNIDYEFKVNNKTVKSGQVILPATFILGCEFAEVENEDAVPLTQYFDINGIWTCIKIEIGNANRVEFYMQSDTDPAKNFKNIPLLKKK